MEVFIKVNCQVSNVIKKLNLSSTVTIICQSVMDYKCDFMFDITNVHSQSCLISQMSALFIVVYYTNSLSLLPLSTLYIC